MPDAATPTFDQFPETSTKPLLACDLIKLVQAHFPTAQLVFDQYPPVITP